MKELLKRKETLEEIEMKIYNIVFSILLSYTNTMIEFNKTNINWLIIINLNHFEKYCKIRKNLK